MKTTVTLLLAALALTACEIDEPADDRKFCDVYAADWQPTPVIDPAAPDVDGDGFLTLCFAVDVLSFD